MSARQLWRKPELKLLKHGWPAVMTPIDLSLMQKATMKRKFSSFKTTPSMTLLIIEVRMRKVVKIKELIVTRHFAVVLAFCTFLLFLLASSCAFVKTLYLNTKVGFLFYTCLSYHCILLFTWLYVLLLHSFPLLLPCGLRRSQGWEILLKRVEQSCPRRFVRTGRMYIFLFEAWPRAAGFYSSLSNLPLG